MKEEFPFKAFIICIVVMFIFCLIGMSIQIFAGDGIYRVDNRGCVQWAARQNDLSIKKEKEKLKLGD